MTSRYQQHHNPQPSKPKQSTAEILQAVTDALQMAELGFADLLGDDPPRRIPGLRNLVVWGRSVTNVLQKLRTPEGQRFEEWYAPQREEMEGDELLKYFYRLRSQLLKEGTTPNVWTSVQIRNLNGAELQPLMQNPPPGAEDFFIGDTLGGSGWFVKLPDGTKDKYYVTLPDSLDIDISLHINEPPTTHGGKTLRDTSVEGLATHYIEYLRGLARGAAETFG